MTYVALLRGVNVGGRNKVSMTQLKAALERLGCESVRTYINSGNVLFNDERDAGVLQSLIESTLLQDCQVVARVLVITKHTLERIVSALPSDWRNDETMRCDVMFLWEGYTSSSAVSQIVINPGVDHVRHVDGALLWSVARHQVTQSALTRLIGTDIYKNMTIRNSNTVRRLVELANDQ